MAPGAGAYIGNMGEVKGRLRKSLSKWASSADMEARELQGSLRTVTLRPRGGVPALEAELYDGSALITLVWLGRRRIAGIEPGRQIKVIGRIGVQDKVRVMFNPRYELR